MNPPFQDYPDLAGDNADASRRFLLAKSVDPFPEIRPSLLNSADIYDYVRMTGMLFPFDPSPEYLKSASYEAAISGRCIWWDGSGDKHEVHLSKGGGDEFLLEANSIAFVQVEPYFRLPDYIALRFNLKITHVHRGVLLGTGPLVDPGFVGRLLIPLHNLTTNPYQFRYGEGLIWIEFTKTSDYSEWTREMDTGQAITRKGEFHPFPKNKKDLQPEDYLYKASPHRAIRSSIPDVGRESREFATHAKEISEKVEEKVNKITVFGAVGLLITVIGLVYGTWTLIHEAWKTAKEAQQSIQSVELEGSSKKLDDLQQKVKTLEAHTAEELGIIRKQLEDVSRSIKPIQKRAASVGPQVGQDTVSK